MTHYVLALLLALSASSAAYAQAPDYIPWHWDDEVVEAAESDDDGADDDGYGELGW